MVISRSSIPQQIMKPGIKKKKQGKSVLKKPSKLLGEKLEKSPVRKKLSKGLRQAIGMKNPIKTLFGLNPVGQAMLATSFASSKLDEYNKPENKLKRLKRQKKVLKKRKTGTDRQRARHGSGVLTAAEEKELDRKQKELEEVVNKYMGGSLNKGRM